MSNEEIIINNKLIAKFMGEEFFTDYIYDDFERFKGTERKVKFKTMLVGCDWHEYSNAHNENELCYHLHWDWLMPVVYNILFQTGFSDNEHEKNILHIQQALGNFEITALYGTVVEFIKNHYNKD